MNPLHDGSDLDHILSKKPPMRKIPIWINLISKTIHIKHNDCIFEFPSDIECNESLIENKLNELKLSSKTLKSMTYMSYDGNRDKNHMFPVTSLIKSTYMSRSIMKELCKVMRNIRDTIIKTRSYDNNNVLIDLNYILSENYALLFKHESNLHGFHLYSPHQVINVNDNCIEASSLMHIM